MRLDKFLSGVTDYSRKEISKLAKKQKILLNGEIIRNVDYKISTTDQISILPDNKIYQLTEETPIYLKLNKPAGYISANHYSNKPTIMDLLPIEYRNLIIVGRLDMDTTGIIFLTNDGQWSHKITSPKYQVNKRYLVTLDYPYQDWYQQKLQAGIHLIGEKKACLPAQVEVISTYQVILTISEGKYHQIKRMFTTLGNHVVALTRLSIAEIEVTELATGEYALLTEQELQILRDSCIRK